MIDPSVLADTEARFVDDGDIVTSAGVSAGIDMALHLVARLESVDAARARAPRHPVRPRAPGMTGLLDAPVLEHALLPVRPGEEDAFEAAMAEAPAARVEHPRLPRDPRLPRRRAARDVPAARSAGTRSRRTRWGSAGRRSTRGGASSCTTSTSRSRWSSTSSRFRSNLPASNIAR